MYPVKEVKILKSIRIQPSLLQRAKAVAKREERSLNSVLCNAITKGLPAKFKEEV